MVVGPVLSHAVLHMSSSVCFINSWCTAGPRSCKAAIVPTPASAHSNVANRQDIGYSPKVPLAEGVQRFCKWFKNYYDIRDGKPANIADFNYNPL